MQGDDRSTSTSLLRPDTEARKALTVADLSLSTARELVDPVWSLVPALPDVRFGSAALIVGAGGAAIDAVVKRICQSALMETPSIRLVAMVDLDATAERLAEQFSGFEPTLLDRLLVGVRSDDKARSATMATASDAYLAASAVLGSPHAPGLVVVRLRTTQAATVKTLVIAAAMFEGLARSELAAIVVAVSGPAASETLEHTKTGAGGAVIVSGKAPSRSWRSATT